MPEFVDLRLVDGVALPYEPGAHGALGEGDRDAGFAVAWDALTALFPGLSLDPLFDALPLPELADLVDAVRTAGDEPPDPFVWFTVACDEAVVEALVPLLQELPFVEWAGHRPPVFPAGTVSWGTNPDAIRTLQIQPAPHGVDAIHTWQVAGGTGEGVALADVEHGWDLGHEELLIARIVRASVFGSAAVDHGTGVLGILVGGDNGVGTIGIVPDAGVQLVTVDRGGAANLAAAIPVAARAVGPGGVLLLEVALNFFAGGAAPDILVEFHPPTQIAIRLATRLGVTVIEPAGNGGIDLDAFPFLAHTQPDSPLFVDSGAVVVGAGELGGDALDFWERTFSSFGKRVDCFAAGSRIQAPSSSTPSAYQSFGGTSGASAIVAGVAVAVQGMARAATGSVLAPADIRRLLRDRSLGTRMPTGFDGTIGAMPDLRKIARAQGWARILPVGAAAIGGDSLVIAHLDDDDRLVRRHWTFFTGWGIPLPLPPSSAGFRLLPGQPAVTSVEEQDPIARLVHEAVLVGPGGVHHQWWDSNGQAGDLTVPLTPVSAAAQGRSLAAVRAADDATVVVAVNPAGRLVSMVGDARVHLSGGLSTPVPLDDVGNYRRIAGPVAVSRAPGLVDVVAIEDGGTLAWFSGTTFATIGTGWSAGVRDLSGTSFEPGARPALLVLEDSLLAAAVGSEGWLRVVRLDPLTGTIDQPVVVDVQVTSATSGPVALARAGEIVVVLAVDTESVLRAATRPAAGGEWTPLAAVPAPIAVSPLGGVTAVSLADLGVMAVVVGANGAVASALSRDGLDWHDLQPLP